MGVISGFRHIYLILNGRPGRRRTILLSMVKTGGSQLTIGKKCRKMDLLGGSKDLSKWAIILMHSGSIIFSDSFASGAFLLMRCREYWEDLFLPFLFMFQNSESRVSGSITGDIVNLILMTILLIQFLEAVPEKWKLNS